MSSNLKVTFVDNSESQYDENAALIDCGLDEEHGDLYLGDRYAASMLQLKHRRCRYVVNCGKSTHGLSKEESVKYHNIDVTDDSLDVLKSAYAFIDKALSKGKNVTVLCETGNMKSATTIIYYLMRKISYPSQDALDLVKKARASVRLKPSLLEMLAKEDKTLGLKSAPRRISSRKNRNSSSNKSGGSNTGIKILIGMTVFFGGLYLLLTLMVG